MSDKKAYEVRVYMDFEPGSWLGTVYAKDESDAENIALALAESDLRFFLERRLMDVDREVTFEVMEYDGVAEYDENGDIVVESQQM